MSCDHPPDAMKWIKEGVLSALCECSHCGRKFKVKGWLNRNASQAFTHGAKTGLLNGSARSIYRDIRNEN
jgi:hypothetical protein